MTHDEEELTKPGRISGFVEDHDHEGADEVTQVDEKFRNLTSDGMDPIHIPDGVHHDIDADFDDLPTPPPKP